MFPCLSSGALCSSGLFQGTKRGVGGWPRERPVDKVGSAGGVWGSQGPENGLELMLKNDKGQLERRTAGEADHSSLSMQKKWTSGKSKTLSDV
ncbi:hypothetical protein PBY51_020724 [Eleginops maclovinus]|uniref:Uncharacterized protein n=1 Tax=Eleginops maclovinus TaxID=56733 RepID=A0AAN7XTX7_ELEMC|nr:hypothetical protein PBY51_020724 [Eleginops maclovinus]